MQDNVHIKHLGLCDYQSTFDAMKAFTQQRDESTPDEIWYLEHSPVFTQGQAGKKEHILNPNHSIPIVQSDRGGQVSYHGPRQLIVYFLCNLRISTSPLSVTKNKILSNLFYIFFINSCYIWFYFMFRCKLCEKISIVQVRLILNNYLHYTVQYIPMLPERNLCKKYEYT